MRYLIAETVALKPHLETAGELALALRDQGHEVVYSWLGDDLPWSDWHLPRIAVMLGCSLDRREKRFEQLLARERIRIVPPTPVAQQRQQELRAWSEQFSGDAEDLKRYGLEGAMLGMGALSSLISLTGNSAYDPSDDLLRARQCLLSSALVFERARQLIAAVKPDYVITFNGRFATTKPILQAAEIAGIKTLRHERGATFERYELFTDAIHNYAYIRQRIRDTWEKANPAERERIGHEFFRRRRGGDGIGWYSYTNEQERGHIPQRTPGKRRVVYFTSSDDEYAAVTDVFTPGPWPDQLHAVDALLKAVAATPDVELIMRLHPHLSKKSAAERERWLGFAAPNIHLIAPEEKIDSYALLDSADIVVSYGSTIGMEAAYAGKPSILIGPCSYAGSPAVYEPKTQSDIVALLAQTPAARDQSLCLPYGYYYLSYGTPFRYYKPQSLSEGVFLGERLGWDPDIVHWLRRQKPIKTLSRTLLKRK